MGKVNFPFLKTVLQASEPSLMIVHLCGSVIVCDNGNCEFVVVCWGGIGKQQWELWICGRVLRCVGKQQGERWICGHVLQCVGNQSLNHRFSSQNKLQGRTCYNSSALPGFQEETPRHREAKHPSVITQKGQTFYLLTKHYFSK